jgi:hypothetical protein
MLGVNGGAGRLNGQHELRRSPRIELSGMYYCTVHVQRLYIIDIDRRHHNKDVTLANDTYPNHEFQHASQLIHIRQVNLRNFMHHSYLILRLCGFDASYPKTANP